MPCGAVASYVICPLIAGVRPLIAGWQRETLAATGLEGYKSVMFKEVRKQRPHQKTGLCAGFFHFSSDVLLRTANFSFGTEKWNEIRSCW